MQRKLTRVLSIVTLLLICAISSAQHYDVSGAGGVAQNQDDTSTPYSGSGGYPYAYNYYGTGTKQCSGTVTLTFTYNDDGTGLPPPNNVVLSYFGYSDCDEPGSDNSGLKNSVVDDGFEDEPVLGYYGGTNSYWELDSSSDYYHYEVKTILESLSPKYLQI